MNQQSDPPNREAPLGAHILGPAVPPRGERAERGGVIDGPLGPFRAAGGASEAQVKGSVERVPDASSAEAPDHLAAESAVAADSSDDLPWITGPGHLQRPAPVDEERTGGPEDDESGDEGERLIASGVLGGGEMLPVEPLAGGSEGDAYGADRDSAPDRGGYAAAGPFSAAASLADPEGGASSGAHDVDPSDLGGSELPPLDTRGEDPAEGGDGEGAEPFSDDPYWEPWVEPSAGDETATVAPGGAAWGAGSGSGDGDDAAPGAVQEQDEPGSAEPEPAEEEAMLQPYTAQEQHRDSSASAERIDEEMTAETGGEVAADAPAMPHADMEIPGVSAAVLREIADRLERIARSLRAREGDDLGTDATDPLEVLITGYALGYSEGVKSGASHEGEAE